MTAVRIGLDPRSWREVPRAWPAGPSPDYADWSHDIAQRVWQDFGKEPSSEELERLSAAITELVRSAQEAPADHAYLLLRNPTDVPLLVFLTIRPAAGDRAKALRQLVSSSAPSGADDLPEQVARINSHHLGQGVRLRRRARLSQDTDSYIVDYAFRSTTAHADVHLSATYPSVLGASPGAVLLDIFAKSIDLDGNAPGTRDETIQPGATATRQNPLQPILDKHERYTRNQERAKRVLIGHRVVITAFAVSFSAAGIVAAVTHWNPLPFFVWLWSAASFGPLVASWLCQRPEQRAPDLMPEIQGLTLILVPLTVVGTVLRPLPGAIGLAADASTLVWMSVVRRRERSHA